MKSDPTGFNTLKRVLGEEDMVAFQKKWEKLTLGAAEVGGLVNGLEGTPPTPSRTYFAPDNAANAG